MRIAYIATYNPSSVSGGSVHVKQFMDKAIEQGHELYTWPANKHPGAKKFPPSRLQRLAILRQLDAVYYRLEWSLPGLARLMKSPRRYLIGDSVYVWEFNTIPEYGVLKGYSDEQIESEFKKIKRFAPDCDVAICVSNAIAEYIVDNFNLSNIVVVPNGSDPRLFDPIIPPVSRIEIGKNILNIVWIGSADIGWHNFELLGKAARLVNKDPVGRQMRFHIIGKGLHSAGDLPRNVLYHGSEDYEKLSRWLNAMDIGLCLYSHGPGFFSSPLKAFDYMASGLAIVSTPQAQLKEIFQELGQSDLMIPSESPRALAKTLIRLANNRARIKKLGDRGRQLVVNHYNWDRAVRDTFVAINEAVARKTD